MSARNPRVLLVAVSLFAVVDLGLFFWYVNATIIQQPSADMYSLVQYYLGYRVDGEVWEYLWAPHNEHRPVFLRLLTAFDIEMFSDVSYPFVVATLVAHLVTAWVLWRECRAGARGRFGWVLGCVVVMLVLTSVAAVVIAIPIMNNLIHGLTFAVLAIVVVDRAGEAEVAPERTVYWRRGAALLVACFVPLADAVGWVVWPILLWLAWRSGAGRRWVFTMGAAGTALFVIYVRGLPFAFPDVSGAAGQETAMVDELVRRASYLFTYMGLPWTRASALLIPGRLLGALLLVTGAGLVV